MYKIQRNEMNKYNGILLGPGENFLTTGYLRIKSIIKKTFKRAYNLHIKYVLFLIPIMGFYRSSPYVGTYLV